MVLGCICLHKAAVRRYAIVWQFHHLQTCDDAKADLEAIVTANEQTFQAFGGAVMTLMIVMSRHDELQNASSALMPNFVNTSQIIAFAKKEEK